MNYTLSQVGHQLQQQKHRLPMLVVLLLCVYLAYFIARLTWQVIPAPELAEPTRVQTPAAVTAADGKAKDINRLIALNMFGEANQAPVEQTPVVEEAPETDLNLTLTGVVASNVEELGAAIIEHKGGQNTYGLGDKIDGTRATVQQIHADRILIKNGVRTETLMLDGLDYEKNKGQARTSAPSPRTPPAQRTEPDERELTDMRDQLLAQPQSFADYLAINQSINEQGEVIGYRVSPGKNPALFKITDLRNNDIVTEINGLDLTDPRQALEAMNTLKSEPSLQLTVLRDGQLETLFIDLPQGDEEPQSR